MVIEMTNPTHDKDTNNFVGVMMLKKIYSHFEICF